MLLLLVLKPYLNAGSLFSTISNEGVFKGNGKPISNGDSAAFKQIAGDDYVDINFGGIKTELHSMLNDLHNFKGFSVSFSEQSQRVYGNFALRQEEQNFQCRKN
jgi:hypothetical protein